MKEKGIILELRKKEAVVVNNRGQYKRIKRVNGMFLGQMVNYNSQAMISNKIYRYIAAASGVAALLVFMVFSSVLFMNSLQPKVFAYIDIDINPSMEFSIDEDERVISLEPLNSDAERITDSLDLKGININNAVSMVIQKLEEKGFIAPQKKNMILISSSSINKDGLSKVQIDNNNSKLNKTVIALKESILKKKRGIVSVKTIHLPKEVKRPTKSNKISIGRYVLYSNAVKNGINITQDEAKSIPLKELIEKTTDKDTVELALKESKEQKVSLNKEETKNNISSVDNIEYQDEETLKEENVSNIYNENANNVDKNKKSDKKPKLADEHRKSDDKDQKQVDQDMKSDDKNLKQVDEDRRSEDKNPKQVDEDKKNDDKNSKSNLEDSKSDDKKPRPVHEDRKTDGKDKIKNTDEKVDQNTTKATDASFHMPENTPKIIKSTATPEKVEKDKTDKRPEHSIPKSKDQLEEKDKENSDIAINKEKTDDKTDDKTDEKNKEHLKPKPEDKENITDKPTSKSDSKGLH